MSDLNNKVALVSRGSSGIGRAVAKELASDGVRVNAVSPGPTDTPIFGKMEVPEEQLGEMRGGILQQVPLRRFGTPAEVASVVGFLASPAASFVTGAPSPRPSAARSHRRTR